MEKVPASYFGLATRPELDCRMARPLSSTTSNAIRKLIDKELEEQGKTLSFRGLFG